MRIWRIRSQVPVVCLHAYRKRRRRIIQQFKGNSHFRHTATLLYVAITHTHTYTYIGAVYPFIFRESSAALKIGFQSDTDFHGNRHTILNKSDPLIITLTFFITLSQGSKSFRVVFTLGVISSLKNYKHSD